MDVHGTKLARTFFLHLGIATVATASGLTAALILGLAGTIGLFAPVVVADQEAREPLSRGDGQSDTGDSAGEDWAST